MRYPICSDPISVTTLSEKVAAASARVLGISELLEQILYHLGDKSPKDLIRAQRVSKTFRDAIQHSSALQTRLYLVRSDKLPWDARFGHLNPYIERFMSLRGLTFSWSSGSKGKDYIIIVVRARTQRSKPSMSKQQEKVQARKEKARRFRGSWRKMLVSDDSRDLAIVEASPCCMWTVKRKISKHDLRELRMGEFMDSLTYCLKE